MNNTIVALCNSKAFQAVKGSMILATNDYFIVAGITFLIEDSNCQPSVCILIQEDFEIDQSRSGCKYGIPTSPAELKRIYVFSDDDEIIGSSPHNEIMLITSSKNIARTIQSCKMFAHTNENSMSDLCVSGFMNETQLTEYFCYSKSDWMINQDSPSESPHSLFRNKNYIEGKALISIVHGSNLSLSEYEQICHHIKSMLDFVVHIEFGWKLDPNLSKNDWNAHVILGEWHSRS